jgi:uncharacterized protein
MSASALYMGTVRHRRLAGHSGEFRHPVAFAYLDLDELPSLLGGRLVRATPGLVRVRRRDLLGGAQEYRDVRAAVRDLITQRTGRPAAAGPVRVLTQPRTLGTCFNPVSFYYAFDGDGRLDAVVAEVTNTPWGQRHAYVVRDDPRGASGVLRGAHRKALHVSPFQAMERRYHWAASTPGPTLSVHIENRRPGDGAVEFDATLKLRRHALTTRALRASVARHPTGTVRVLALIYGHAFALALRGVPHLSRPTTGGTRR